VMRQLESYSKAIHLAPEDVIVSWLPLYHDMGLIAGFIMPILQKIPLVLLSPFDWVRAPYRLLQAVSQFSGSLTWLPNFAYNFLALKTRDRDLEGVNLSSWRAVINCSEPMHWKSHQLFLERFSAYQLKPEALATCYAMAENVFAVSQGGILEPVNQDRIDQRTFFDAHIAEPAQDSRPSLVMLSAGKPIPNTQVRVLDEGNRELPDRHIGEIAIQSDCMLSGYYHREEVTERSFYDGWYLTGDLGYLADGVVYITGRKKDLIIVGGKNVYPQDLENLAGEVKGVYPGRVVAFGLFNETSGTEDVMIIAELDSEALQLQEDEPIDEGATAQAANLLADEIRQRVTRGSDITLRYVKVVPRGWLLKTSSGKIARSANRDKYLKLINQ
jgi:fatty-acyl-CoA synthase